MQYLRGLMKAPTVPVLNVHGQITSYMTDKIRYRLDKLPMGSATALALSIDSSGGAAIQADFIEQIIQTFKRKHKIPVYTFGRQVVIGPACLLLFAGDKVTCDPLTIIGRLRQTNPKINMASIIKDSGLNMRKIISDQSEQLYSDTTKILNPINQQQILNNDRLSQQQYYWLKQRLLKLRKHQLLMDDSLSSTVISGSQAYTQRLIDGSGTIVEKLTQWQPKSPIESESDPETSVFRHKVR